MRKSIETLLSRPPRNGTYPSIAIDGPGGAGKTTLARNLQQLLAGRMVQTHGDDYFEPLKSGTDNVFPGYFNADRFMQEVGSAVNAGERSLPYCPYDWALGRTVLNKMHVEGGLIHEGVKSLALPIDWDVRIWVEAPRDTRRVRCVEVRTDEERRAKGASRAELGNRFEAWADEAAEYERSVNPAVNADVVIPGTLPFAEQLSMLSDR